MAFIRNNAAKSDSPGRPRTVTGKKGKKKKPPMSPGTRRRIIKTVILALSVAEIGQLAGMGFFGYTLYSRNYQPDQKSLAQAATAPSHPISYKGLQSRVTAAQKSAIKLFSTSSPIIPQALTQSALISRAVHEAGANGTPANSVSVGTPVLSKSLAQVYKVPVNIQFTHAIGTSQLLSLSRAVGHASLAQSIHITSLPLGSGGTSLSSVTVYFYQTSSNVPTSGPIQYQQ